MTLFKYTFLVLIVLLSPNAMAASGDLVYCDVNTSEHGPWATVTSGAVDTIYVINLCRSQGGTAYIIAPDFEAEE